MIFFFLKGRASVSKRMQVALDETKIMEEKYKKCGCGNGCEKKLSSEIILRYRRKIYSVPQGCKRQNKLLDLYRETQINQFNKKNKMPMHMIEGESICL